MKKLAPIILIILGIAAIIFYQYAGDILLKRNGIKATGTIEATEYALGSPIGGIIESLKVKEGEQVAAGDTIGVIKHQDLLADKKAIESAIEAAGADVSQTETRLANAKRNLARLQGVARSGSIADQKIDDADTAFKQLSSAYEAAKSQQSRLQHQLESLNEKISYATVTAPVSGTIVERYFEPGELAPGGGTLVKLANLSEVWIKIYIPEKELGKIKVGNDAAISIDSFPDKNFTGKVTWISPVAEFTPKNVQTEEERVLLVFAVKIAIPNNDGVFKIGLPATVKIKS